MNDVGVIVLTYNRAAEITRTVDRLVTLPERPRIVVVDNGSSDGTPALLRRRFPGLEILSLGENRGAAARNVGVERVQTPYIAFCDDDTWWAPGSLARARALLEGHARLALVTARVLVGHEQREDPACAAMAASPLQGTRGFPGVPVLGFLAGASMVRRTAFRAVGGFEPRFFLGGEEALMAIDLATAGWGLAYVADVVVYHDPSPVRDSRRRRRLITRNDLWCAWLRRPATVAARQTLRPLREAWRHPDAVWALACALVGAGWVLRRRRVIPPALDQALRQLELASSRRLAVRRRVAGGLRAGVSARDWPGRA